MKFSVVKVGERLVQLILHPTVQTKNQVKRDMKEKARFGSSDAFWLQVLSSKLPELTLFINRKMFSGLLDIGADICYDCLSMTF